MSSATLRLIRENSLSIGEPCRGITHLCIDVERAYIPHIKPHNTKFAALCGDFIEATRGKIPTIRIGHWLFEDEKPNMRIVHPSPGTQDYVEIFPNAPPLKGEQVLFKPNFSAFEGTDLREHVPADNILLISGAFTSLDESDMGCVDATISDARILGYKVAIVRDLLFPQPRTQRYWNVEDVTSAQVLQALNL